MKKYFSFLMMASVVLFGCTKEKEQAEELFLALEGLEEQLTMVYNVTVNNPEDQALYAGNETYETLCENVTAILSGVQQTISIKKTWIEECQSKHTLSKNFEEIYASFEQDIQIPLTQAKNLYDDGILQLKQDGMYEELAMALESLQQQWSMVYRFVSNDTEAVAAAANQKKEAEYEAILSEAIVSLSAVSQTIQTKQIWIEECYNDGSLADHFEEIYMSFETDIQIPLTMIQNAYNQAVSELLGL